MHAWIDSSAALADWLRGRTAATIGLDTEFMRTDTFRARLALIQIDVGGDVALLDAAALPRPAPLLERLHDERTTTVMHSAGEDLEALLPLLPDGPAGLFDTQIAAALAGVGFGLSYQKLVAALLGVELAKSETRSDWLRRPLSAAQLDYAAQDVVWLPRLHETLAAQLERLGRLEWLRQDCRALIDRVCHPQPDEQPQHAYRSAADWPLDQQARLRRLLRWRDAAARALDKPKPWLLDDPRLLQLASKPPRDGNELFERTRGLRALRSAQRAEVLALLQDDDAAGADSLVPIPPPLDAAQRRTLAAMKDAVAAAAATLGVADVLLCSKRHLEALLTYREWPAALQGWREPLLKPVLMPLLQ